MHPRTRPTCHDRVGWMTSPENARHTAQLQALGYSSFRSFWGTLGEFISAHDFAFRGMAKAHVMQEGGLEWSRRPQKVLRFYLKCAPDINLHRNPSRAFRFRGHEFAVLGDMFRGSSITRQDWENMVKDEEERGAYASDPNYAGLLSVRFIVEGVPIVQTMHYPQYRSNADSDGCPSGKARLLHSMVSLWSSSINEGFPLHSVGDQHHWIAMPGRYSCSKGSWTWRPFFSRWEDYRPGSHKRLDSTYERLPFDDDVSPKELMAIFGAWVSSCCVFPSDSTVAHDFLIRCSDSSSIDSPLCQYSNGTRS